MSQKFDMVFDNVEMISVGPVDKVNGGAVFDIHIRESSGFCFSLRCNMTHKVTEDKGIYYFGLKGVNDE